MNINTGQQQMNIYFLYICSAKQNPSCLVYIVAIFRVDLPYFFIRESALTTYLLTPWAGHWGEFIDEADQPPTLREPTVL